jgi:hypothetical protein
LHRLAPTDADREAMQARLAFLDGLLAAAEKRDIAHAIADLLGAFPHAKVSPQEAKERMASYGSPLVGLPGWAIRETVSDYKAGRAARPDHTFAPSSAELRIAVMDKLTPVHLEAQKIRRVLDARVIAAPVESERARAVERWEDIRERIFAPVIKQRADEREALRRELQAVNERILDKELRAHGIRDGLKIGVGLRAKLEAMGAEFPQPPAEETAP